MTWRAVFLINVPVGIFVVLASRFVPESRDPEAGKKPATSFRDGRFFAALALARDAAAGDGISAN